MDTQWKRFEVLQKERSDLPYRNVGSVHAPDAEIALENARDVFVRRPGCLGLWIVPASAIFARTAQELQSGLPSAPDETGERELYLVFQKQGQVARETYVAHVGEVEGSSPQHALARALERFAADDVFVWWVVPAAAVIRSAEGDAESMFDPAQNKPFRNHLSYPVEGILRKLKALTNSGNAQENA